MSCCAEGWLGRCIKISVASIIIRVLGYSSLNWDGINDCNCILLGQIGISLSLANRKFIQAVNTRDTVDDDTLKL